MSQVRQRRGGLGKRLSTCMPEVRKAAGGPESRLFHQRWAVGWGRSGGARSLRRPLRTQMQAPAHLSPVHSPARMPPCTHPGRLWGFQDGASCKFVVATVAEADAAATAEATAEAAATAASEAEAAAVAEAAAKVGVGAGRGCRG